MFKKVQIIGHQRSGNHWLCGVVAKNFFNDLKNYLAYCWLCNHSIPLIDWKPTPNKKYLYISRNWDDVSKSVYKLRKRLSLSTSSYKEFLSKRYCDMYSSSIEGGTYYTDENNNKKFTTKTSEFFKNIKQTPFQFYNNHINIWTKLIERNPECMLHVKYEILYENFDSEMIKISKFLKSNKVEFKNINFKIGCIDV